MIRQGKAYVFFGGALLGLLNEGVLDSWEPVAYERFAYDGMGGKGAGESAVYRKIAAQMTAADQQLRAKFGEPPQDWVAPIGWVDDGRAWLTWGEDGRIKIDTKAAAVLRGERFVYGGKADHPHAVAAAAVMLVLDALTDNTLDRT
jgi:hypothetical protein